MEGAEPSHAKWANKEEEEEKKEEQEEDCFHIWCGFQSYMAGQISFNFRKFRLIQMSIIASN